MSWEPLDDETIVDLKKLWEPFPPEAMGTLPATQKRPALNYVGHAAVTKRLLEVDPSWSWEPMARDMTGQPVYDLDPDGRPVGLWINLTVCGVTRPGYGSVETNAIDAVKQLIGDALRNAAMRFGVALDLWSREESIGSTLAGPPEDPLTEEEQESLKRIINRQAAAIQDDLREWWGKQQQQHRLVALRYLTPSGREKVMAKLAELGGDLTDPASVAIPTGDPLTPEDVCARDGHSWTLNEDLTERICVNCGEVQPATKEAP